MYMWTWVSGMQLKLGILVGCSGWRTDLMFKSCKGVVWLLLKAFISCDNCGVYKLSFEVMELSPQWALYVLVLARMAFSCMSSFVVLVDFVFCILLPVRLTRKGMMAKWFGNFSVISEEIGLWISVDLNWPVKFFYIFL